jgi:hypothetical protein
VAGTLVWQQSNEGLALNPLHSNAGGEPQPHWPHATVPAQVTLLNSMSNSWKTHLATTTKDWQQSGAINYRVVASAQTEGDCLFYPESIHMCSFKDPDSFIIAWSSYLYWNATGHITGAIVNFNDAYFFNPSLPNASAWRNNINCLYVGTVSGMSTKPVPRGKSTSCMEWSQSNDRILNQQHPDNEDLSSMKRAYDHRDDTSSSGVSSQTNSANNRRTPERWGRLSSVSADGKTEIYKLDLGNGLQMVTTAYKK